MNKYEISILNEYTGFRFKNKNKLIEKIFDLILTVSDIRQKSPVFKYNYKALCFDIMFCDDTKIKEINRTFRGKDHPTDVITFALFSDCEIGNIINDKIHLGEIIISYPTALRQATCGIEKEIVTLITHGILHLLGFDHQNEMDYNFIVGIQNDIIKELSNDKISI